MEKHKGPTTLVPQRVRIVEKVGDHVVGKEHGTGETEDGDSENAAEMYEQGVAGEACKISGEGCDPMTMEARLFSDEDFPALSPTTRQPADSINGEIPSRRPPMVTEAKAGAATPETAVRATDGVEQTEEEDRSAGVAAAMKAGFKIEGNSRRLHS